MILDRTFLLRCAHTNNLNLPQKLKDWLLAHFEEESYEDFHTTPILEDMICMYFQSYVNSMLDMTIPHTITCLRDRCEDLIMNLWGISATFLLTPFSLT